MIKIILQVLLAIVVFRLIGSLFGFFRGKNRQKTSVGAGPDHNPVENNNYDELTPYEIEDAEYEEMPKRD